MTEKTRRRRNRKKPGPGTNQQPGQQQPANAAEFKKKKQEDVERKRSRRVELAADDNYQVVPRKSDETNEMIALMAKNDHLITLFRGRMGRPRFGIPDVTVLERLKRQQEIRDMLNEQNAALCKDMGFDYEAPKGYELDQKSDQKGSQPPKKASAQPPSKVAAPPKASQKNSQDKAEGSPASAEQLKGADGVEEQEQLAA